MNNIPKVKITSKGFFKDTHILVGNQELHVTRAIIELDGRDGYARLKLETFADLVDIDVLEKNTEIVIKGRDG